MRAISLISGGLDSILSTKLILEQGLEVIGMNFVSPFYLLDGGGDDKKKPEILAKRLKIELKVINNSKDFLEIVKSPKFGYGKNLNPCIDCRVLMLRKAKDFMRKIDANFIVIGEVLGQRPMTQNRRVMELIEKESGLEGLIVRPLSARLLPPTIPEKEGWIKREELLDISGRSRKRQLELAKEYNISDYLSPGGGCLLTEPIFSLKIKDLLNSQMLDSHSINLIKNGRYFSISNSFKLVVGRNEEENQRLDKAISGEDIVFEPQSKGPLGVGWGKKENKVLETATKIVSYYCKRENVKVNLKSPSGEKMPLITGEKISKEELAKYKVELKGGKDA